MSDEALFEKGMPIRPEVLDAEYASASCGIPAGLDAFKAANDVLLKQGALPGPG